MKKTLLSGLIGLFAAQPTLAMDLVETYEKAISYDSGIASARAQLAAQQAGIDISRSSLLPQIGLFGELADNELDDNGQDISYRESSYGIQLTQPLFRAEDWFRYDGSKFQSKAAQAQYNLAQQQLMLDVATAYFNVLRAEDGLTTALATEAAIQRQYEQAQERFDVGLIAITEVYEARASYDAVKSQRIAAESELDIARERLARLTGEYTKDLDNLTQAFPLMRPDPMDPSAWEQTAVARNWQIQSAIYELNTNEASLKTAKSGHLPTLDLSARWAKSDVSDLDAPAQPQQLPGQSSQAGDGTERQIALTLNVPLYMGGGTQAGVRQQRSLVEVAQQSLATVRRDVRVNARSLFLTVNTNIESASALEQTIISRRSALDATRAGYEVGTRNIVEVLDAERAYYVALRDYANARYDYIINTFNLKLAAGILSPRDLAGLNEWLSPTAPGIEALANETKIIDDPTR
jgi:outer membrane protein